MIPSNRFRKWIYLIPLKIYPPLLFPSGRIGNVERKIILNYLPNPSHQKYSEASVTATVKTLSNSTTKAANPVDNVLLQNYRKTHNNLFSSPITVLHQIIRLATSIATPFLRWRVRLTGDVFL